MNDSDALSVWRKSPRRSTRSRKSMEMNTGQQQQQQRQQEDNKSMASSLKQKGKQPVSSAASSGLTSHMSPTSNAAVDKQWDTKGLELFFEAYNTFKIHRKTTRTGPSGSSNTNWTEDAANYMKRRLSESITEDDVEALYQLHSENIDTFSSAVELIAAHRSLVAYLSKLRSRTVTLPHNSDSVASPIAMTENRTPSSSRSSRSRSRSIRGSSSVKRKTPSRSGQRNAGNPSAKRVKRVLKFDGTSTDESDGCTSNTSSSTSSARNSIQRRRKQMLVPTPLPPDTDNSIFDKILERVQNQKSNSNGRDSTVTSALSPIEPNSESQSSSSDTVSSPVTYVISPHMDSALHGNSSIIPVPSSPSSVVMKKRLEKQLPLKLRGKGTHGGMTNKIIAQILETSTSPNFRDGEIDPHDQRALDVAERMGQQFAKLLSHPKARKFLRYEWFYSNIDYGYFMKNDFISCLHELGIGDVRFLTRAQWTDIRAHFSGTPRRFSKKFLAAERQRLHEYRTAVRMYYEDYRERQMSDNMTLLANEQQQMFHMLDDLDIANPPCEGHRCLVYNPETCQIHVGTVVGIISGTRDTMFKRRYNVHLDHEEASKSRIFDDCHIMSFTISGLIGGHSVDDSSLASHILSDGKKRKAQYWESSTLFEMPQLHFNPTRTPPPLKRSQVVFMTPPPPQLSSSSSSSVMSSPFSFVVPHRAMQMSPQNAGSNHSMDSFPNNEYLQLVDSLSSNIAQLAQYSCQLRKKQRLLDELSTMNDEAERRKHEHDCVPASEQQQFTMRYAHILTQIQEINASVNGVLHALHHHRTNSASQFTPPVMVDHHGVLHTRPHNHRDNVQSSIRHHECQELFNNNREAASSTVGHVRQILLRRAAETIPGNEAQPIQVSQVLLSSNSAAQKMINECVAYLMHLRSCVESQSMTAQEASLTLDAALLAIKPSICIDSDSGHALKRVYGEVEQLAKTIKETLVDGVEPWTLKPEN